jgi:hypothetical protein
LGKKREVQQQPNGESVHDNSLFKIDGKSNQTMKRSTGGKLVVVAVVLPKTMNK